MQKTIYALGFFDGVHLGHKALMEETRRLAVIQGCRAGVVTFDSHPDALVLGAAPGLICTPEEREAMLRRDYFMEDVVSLPFDREMQATPWRDFLNMLVERYGAAGFVCGADFRFGARGQGTAVLMESFCLEQGLCSQVVPEQTVDGVRVSSTYIRTLVEAGNMADAARFLGHPYRLSGTVAHGKRLGSRLGFPTANLPLPGVLAVPRFGVYACKVKAEGAWYTAVTNLGIRPTVSGEGITVESWLLSYEGDLYGKPLTLDFHGFLRPEKAFPDLDALRRQIQEDAAHAQEFFRNHPAKQQLFSMYIKRQRPVESI